MFELLGALFELIGALLELLFQLVFAPMKWLLGKLVVRWDRTVDSWGPAGRRSDPATAAANNRGPREERPETPVPAADIRVLHCIAGDAWWSPENEREADSQRWLLLRGLIVEDGQRGLALTPEGRRLI